jgi:hypothetical protein
MLIVVCVKDCLHMQIQTRRISRCSAIAIAKEKTGYAFGKAGVNV